MMQTRRLPPPGQGGRVWYLANTSPMPMSHRHAELEVNLVREGAAAYLLGERRYEMRRGTLAWLFPAQDHILLEQSPGFEMWIGVFAPEFVERVCAGGPAHLLGEANPPGRFCRFLPESEADWLHQLFGRVRTAQHDAPRFEAGMGHTLLSAWAAFDAAEDVPAGTDVHPAVERAARLMRDETDPLTLEQMAARVGLSAPRLSTLFKQQTGMALTQFRNRQRLERFVRLYGRGQRIRCWKRHWRRAGAVTRNFTACSRR